MNIEDLVASVKGGVKSSKYQLDAESEHILDEFVEWLMNEAEPRKTQATSQSYRSYCAKAMYLDQAWDELTSDQRSAVRALAEFNRQHGLEPEPATDY